MKRFYLLQELYIIDNFHYWWDVCNGYDLKMLKRLKDLYKSKNTSSIYRIIEVVY